MLSKYDFRFYDQSSSFGLWLKMTKQNWSNVHLKSVHKMHSVNHVESLKVDIEVIIDLEETMILPTQIEN